MKKEGGIHGDNHLNRTYRHIQMPETVLAFDIGIRNLAWCLASKEGTQYTILGWQNYDLLKGEGQDVVKEKEKCAYCSSKPGYFHGEKTTCVRHCPPGHPALRDLSGDLLKKIPTLPVCKKILAAQKVSGSATTKASAETLLATVASLPILRKKVTKALDTELVLLHDAIRKFVTDHHALFKKATHILLENQPVLKNPTMKSVQILLFATLRDLLQPSPPQVKLVHAGKKVSVEAKGDAGYKDRKAASEARVRELLAKTAEKEKWLSFFNGHVKKNDLADAFCMCVDKLG
jgi:hypothetical protein